MNKRVKAKHNLSLGAARLLGLVETEIYAKRMDVDTAFHYVIQNAEVDGDSVDYVRQRLRETAKVSLLR